MNIGSEKNNIFKGSEPSLYFILNSKLLCYIVFIEMPNRYNANQKQVTDR